MLQMTLQMIPQQKPGFSCAPFCSAGLRINTFGFTSEKGCKLPFGVTPLLEITQSANERVCQWCR